MSKENRTTKCSCGANNKITCPNCSELKMVILLKNGFSHLKLVSGTRKVNPVWYNHLSKNKKSHSILYNAMYRRFQASEYANTANRINFYSNTNGKLVISIKV